MGIVKLKDAGGLSVTTYYDQVARVDGGAGIDTGVPKSISLCTA